jgi:hypothetical protein
MPRWKASDRMMLAQLVEKYGRESVTSAATKLPATAPKSKKGGKPRREITDFAEIWAHVELRRDRHGSLDRRPISQACAILAQDLQKYTTNRKISLKRVSVMYYEARRLFRSDPSARSVADECLRRIRSYGKGLVLPALWKRQGENMVSATIDQTALAAAGKALRVRGQT